MQSGGINAGALPAFLEYGKLGAGYALLWGQAAGTGMHAYLLAGPKGVGKMTFARMLALRAFCEGLPKPCGECPACIRVLSGNEPDVIEILPQEDKAIPIDRIRQALAQIAQHAFGSGTRYVIIEPIEKLTPAAQNCLLKSLEEPQANVVFFLLTHEPSAVLGTIASRCAMVKLPPWPDDSLRATLLAMDLAPARIDAALPRAGGNIGVAMDLVSGDGQTEAAAFAAQALSVLRDADVVTLSTRMKDDRAGAERALAALEQSLHLALLIHTGVLPVHVASEPAVLAFAANASEAELTDLLSTLFQTRKWRQSQVNWQASIDRLLMKIVEAKTRWQQS